MLCTHIKNTSACSVVFRNHNFSGTLSPAVALGVYRILQELMNYTLAQPGCSGIEAGLWHQDKNLHFFIRGTGEAPSELQGHPFRLSLPESLFIKTEQIGGRLHVDVVKPAYTNILLVIPCPQPEI
jgi:glucose-6-phosphate-specific signal transduction histidine kinase